MRQRIICREPRARICMRVKPRQVVEKRDLIGDDRRHRRRLCLTVITRGNAGEKLYFSLGALDQDEAQRLTIGAGRTELRQRESRFDGPFRNRALLPRGEGARLAEQLREQSCFFRVQSARTGKKPRRNNAREVPKSCVARVITRLRTRARFRPRAKFGHGGDDMVRDYPRTFRGNCRDAAVARGTTARASQSR